MNLRSLHTRLMLWYATLIVCASTAFCAYTYYSLHYQLFQDLQETLTLRVSHIRDDILPQVDLQKPGAVARHMRDVFSPEKSDVFIRIGRKPGDTLYVSGKLKDYAFKPSAVPWAREYSSGIDTRIEDVGKDRQLMIAGTRITVGNNNYVVEMGAPTATAQAMLDHLTETLLLGLPFAIAVAVLGGSVLIRSAFRPVEAMRATTEQISFSNLRQRLPVAQTGDALERLLVTMNNMLERLDQSCQQATRFAADAAHELRTPLTIMRSELESIVRMDRLPQACRERVLVVLEEAENLSGIVEGLFSLARLDGGEARAVNEHIDLSDLVRTTVEQMQLLAEDKKLSVAIEAPNPVYVLGDAGRLRQVVVNLLDNAIKYTPAGGAITLSVSEQAMKAVFAIKDNGIGIATDSLPHVFDRFYRTDKARTRGVHGAGLGLSIVQSICQVHSGTATIQSTEGVGTTLTVELPLANKYEGKLHAAA